MSSALLVHICQCFSRSETGLGSCHICCVMNHVAHNRKLGIFKTVGKFQEFPDILCDISCLPTYNRGVLSDPGVSHRPSSIF
jgi:hypothetical protein